MRQRPALFLFGARLAAQQTAARWLRPGPLALAALALGVLLVLAAALAAGDRGRHAPVDLHLVYHVLVVLNLLVPAGALLAALAVLGRGREEGGLVYLLVRPCPRAALLVGLLLGAAALPAFCGLAAGGVTLIPLGGGSVPAGQLTALALADALGALAYTSLYGCLVLWCRRTATALFLGAAHLLLWEGFVANLPGTIRDYTFVMNLRVLLDGMAPMAPWPRRLLLPEVHLLRPAGEAALFLTGAAVVAFGLAWYRLVTRDAVGGAES